ncbi:cRISPR-associated RAMP protein, partial [Candidatus Magnetomorum sp. HK-1]
MLTVNGVKATKLPAITHFISGIDSCFVNKSWQNGQAFLGGKWSVGLGRFILRNVGIAQWNIKNALEYQQYLYARGFKNYSFAQIKKFSPTPIFSNFDSVCEDATIFTEGNPWKKICYSITVISPIISKDPVAALFKEKPTDEFMLKKTIVNYDNKGKAIQNYEYFIKSESIKGLLRFIVSKITIDDDVKKFNDDHVNCDCITCFLFGNKYNQGKLRFEDLKISSEIKIKRINHVSIDRFSASGIGHMNFDNYPLSADKMNPLILKGIFWIKTDISEKEKTALEYAFSELKYGFSSLGAFSSIGYGQISDISLDDSNFFRIPKKKLADISCNGYVSLKPDVNKKIDVLNN